MRYISNTAAQQKEMLGRIGAASIEALLSNVPAKARLSRPLGLPAAMAETDLVRHLRALAAKDASADDYACFLGAGSYDHIVPSPINHLISRGEFFTAYTPYQPEASQGTLRTIFEYQTMMAELTGMDVANASIYDGASSLAEAVLMAHAVTGRNETAFSRGVNPLYGQVVETYCEGPDLRLKRVAVLALAVMVFVLVAIPARVVLIKRDLPLIHPYGALAAQLRPMLPEDAFLMGENNLVAGNLRMTMPERTILSPELAGLIEPAQRHCILVWDARKRKLPRGELPRWAEQFEPGALERGEPQYLTAPCKFNSTQLMTLGVMLLK